MIDTHCHLTFPRLADRLDEVLAAAHEAGVDRMITVGTTVDDAEGAQRIAEQHPHVHFAAGMHPHYAPDLNDQVLSRLIELAAHQKCVAFGEMGLDYHYDDPPRDVQQACLSRQLAAIGHSNIDKPVVIHCRRAVDDTLAIIGESGLPGERFVFHCFTETPDDVRKVLDAGMMVSFTGIVTYKNAPEVRESATLVPADRLMVETDAPYLTPEPHRKIRPNEPRYVTATARFLADLRSVAYDEFVQQCDTNAERFYQLPVG